MELKSNHSNRRNRRDVHVSSVAVKSGIYQGIKYFRPRRDRVRVGQGDEDKELYS